MSTDKKTSKTAEKDVVKDSGGMCPCCSKMSCTCMGAGCNAKMSLNWKKRIVAILNAVILFFAFIWLDEKIAPSTVKVKGIAEREVQADYGVWDINISFADDDLAKTQATIQQHQQSVITFLKAQGFSDNEIEKGVISFFDQ